MDVKTDLEDVQAKQLEKIQRVRRYKEHCQAVLTEHGL